MAFLSPTLRYPLLGRIKSRSFPPPSPKWQRRFFGLLIFILCMSTFGMGRAGAQSKEYQLKAAFLYNFAQFVKWPSSSFAADNAPFYIGILGDDPFGGAIEKIIQGESIDNHKLVILRSRNVEDLKDCQLLFISKSEEDHVAKILFKLDARPILLVSEIDGFAQSGGVINLYLQGGKVRFGINPNAAQRRGLKVSSQLLSLGRIIE